MFNYVRFYMKRSLYLLPLVFLLGNEGFAKSSPYSDDSVDDCKDRNYMNSNKNSDTEDRAQNSRNDSRTRDKFSDKNDKRYNREDNKSTTNRAALDDQDNGSFGPLLDKFTISKAKLLGGVCTFDLGINVTPGMRLGSHNVIIGRDQNLRVGLRNKGKMSEITDVKVSFTDRDSTRPVKETFRIDGKEVTSDFFSEGMVNLPVEIKKFDKQKSVIEVTYLACEKGKSCSTENNGGNVGRQILTIGNNCTTTR